MAHNIRTRNDKGEILTFRIEEILDIDGVPYTASRDVEAVLISHGTSIAHLQEDVRFLMTTTHSAVVAEA